MGSLQLGIVRVLALLGLGHDNAADVLGELRQKALIRCIVGVDTANAGLLVGLWLWILALFCEADIQSWCARAGLTEQDVQDSIARRAAARAAKDYAASDAEREFLAGKGILIMDMPTGTVWRPGVQELVPAEAQKEAHFDNRARGAIGVGVYLCQHKNMDVACRG